MQTESQARARRALRESVRLNRRRVEAALPSAFLRMGQKARKKLRLVIGSLADDRARLLAGDILIDELVHYLDQTTVSHRRLYLATFCWDAGLIPTDLLIDLDLGPMRQKVYRALATVGLSGMGVFEITPLRGAKGEVPRFMIHVHAFVWTDDRSFKPKAAATRLMKGGSFPNCFGAPAITFRSRKVAAKNFRAKGGEIYDHLFSDLNRDQTKASVAWLEYYLLQAPAYVKKVCPSKHDPSKSVMRSSLKGYSPLLALALDQLLNRIPVTKAVFSVGDGTAIGRAWRARYKANFPEKADASAQTQRRKCKKAKVRQRHRSAVQRSQMTAAAHKSRVLNAAGKEMSWS